MKAQHCYKCDQVTGRCNEDALYLYEKGPLCETCFDIMYEDILCEKKYYCEKHKAHYEKALGRGNWHEWHCPKCNKL